MIKETSQRHLKIKSREKSRPNSRASQNKPQPIPNRPHKIQTDHHLQTAQTSKVQKSTSKTKINKNVPQSRNSKNLKNQPESHALHMKGNLKQLISKHIGSKPKNNEVVPELLKNIEKHCKELKKIHHKEQKMYDKRISLQENKLEKEKKSYGGNRSHDYEKKKGKESCQKESGKGLSNRLSLQINPKQPKQEDRHPLKNELLCKKSVDNAGNEKNFYQLFKIYKKSFEIEDVKIQKSGKNTNYNTNQSKNSSSMFNSVHGDHNSRYKMKTEDKINMNKIQNLIQSQQKSMSKGNTPEQSGQKETNPRFIHEFELYQEHQDEQKEELNQSLEIQEEREEKIIMMEPLEEKQCKHHQDHNNSSKEATPSKDISASRSPQGSCEKGALEKKFQGSKFYVQPIPSFKPKEEKPNREEDSLEGCEIPLIQNNVIYEDSELMSLQL